MGVLFQAALFKMLGNTWEGDIYPLLGWLLEVWRK